MRNPRRHRRGPARVGHPASETTEAPGARRRAGAGAVRRASRRAGRAMARIEPSTNMLARPIGSVQLPMSPVAFGSPTVRFRRKPTSAPATRAVAAGSARRETTPDRTRAAGAFSAAAIRLFRRRRKSSPSSARPHGAFRSTWPTCTTCTGRAATTQRCNSSASCGSTCSSPRWARTSRGPTRCSSLTPTCGRAIIDAKSNVWYVAPLTRVSPSAARRSTSARRPGRRIALTPTAAKERRRRPQRSGR